jgi:L-amino acid N-acyltransferase YncA
MTAAQITERLARRPEMCQTWLHAKLLDEGDGVLYLSSISEGSERIGMTHIYIWGKAAKGKPDGVRCAAKALLEEHNLDRLVCEIDFDKKLAIRLATRVGFKMIGAVRQRKDERGVRHDVILMDALPGDLDGHLR